MNLEMQDKVVLVAGSSRGIGLAIAEALLREGAKVVIAARHPEALAQARDRLRASAADRLHAVQADLTLSADIQRTLKETVTAFGGLDAVVANVGSGTGPSGWELAEADWTSALTTNFTGSVALASAAMPHLVSRRDSSITFVASIAGIEAIGAPLPYTAAKAALLAVMKSLSRLAGPQGVRVNAVAPGNVLFPGGSWERKVTERRQAIEDMIAREVPLQRFGRPEEIADVVVFLASRRASFITGACLVADGGQTRSL